MWLKIVLCTEVAFVKFATRIVCFTTICNMSDGILEETLSLRREQWAVFSRRLTSLTLMQKPWRPLNSAGVMWRREWIPKFRFGGGGTSWFKNGIFVLVVVAGRQTGDSSLFIVRRIAVRCASWLATRISCRLSTPPWRYNTFVYQGIPCICLRASRHDYSRTID